MRYILLFIFLHLLTITLNAQERVVYGQVVSGSINNQSPQVAFEFDALRCDFVSLRVRITGGNLDPVLTVIDSKGAVLVRRDDSGTDSAILLEPLAIPSNGRYTAVIGRFGYGLGTTSGSFELLIERIGNGSANYCGLRYGDTVYNSIDNMEPELFYFFRARQGDIVNIHMQTRAGDLDPYIRVVDNNSYVLAHNDDFPGAGTDALIQGFMIPADGTYYVIASRYGLAAGSSSGSFLLTVEESENSGIGNSPLAAVPLRAGAAVEGALTESRSEQYYRFEARKDDIISVSMDRTGGNIDAFLVIADLQMTELAVNDDGGDGQNALIADFLVPADGSYYVIATRFERELGTTTGPYRLRLTNQGNAFDPIPANVRRIDYGVSLTDTIDDVNTQVRYAFRGEAGDIITASMNQSDGDLDPFINILAADGVTVLISDDDGGGRPNARIDRYTLPETGIYYIEATRYNGVDNPNTRGGYILVLAQIFDP